MAGLILACGIEAASRYVMDALEIDPVDLAFSCCPDPSGVHSYNSELWLTLAARNLALADEQALESSRCAAAVMRPSNTAGNF